MKKSCVRLFRHRQTLFRRNRPLLLPAFLLLRLRLHGQAGKPPFMNLPRRLLRAHTFCVPGGRSAPLCTQKMAAVPALAVSKIAGEKTKTRGMLYEKMQSVLSQWTVVFSCCGAELFYRRESLYGGGMALPWFRLFVSGCFAAEKIKHSCNPGGGKIWPGLQFFAGLVRIPDKGTEFRQKTRCEYVNETNQPHCRDPL
ncbi:MAG: hypothetical protein UC907_02180 [Faecalibacterium prausnitzii]